MLGIGLSFNKKFIDIVTNVQWLVGNVFGQSTTTRISTEYIPVKVGELYSGMMGSTGFNMSIVQFDNLNQVIADTGWVTSDFINITIAPNCVTLKASIRKNGDAGITLSEKDSVKFRLVKQ